MNFDFICIDFQNDFASPGGINFNKGKSVSFIKEKMFPFLKDHNIQVSEILSDYRLPRGRAITNLAYQVLGVFKAFFLQL